MFMSVTHGGNFRHFKWQLINSNIFIKTEKDIEHTYKLTEVYKIIKSLKEEFNTSWFPLANNVELLGKGIEKAGLAVAILNLAPNDIKHAQGSSYLGVVLEEIGVFKWNGAKKGIKWRIVRLPASIEDLEQTIDQCFIKATATDALIPIKPSFNLSNKKLKQLASIDKELTKQLNLAKSLFDESLLQKICHFKINDRVEDIPWEKLSYPGIYLIEVKNDKSFSSFKDWVTKFQKEWENDLYQEKFTPNLKKKRIDKHNILKDWIPLYLGKSKNIYKRVHGHIHLNLENKTYALKLLSRKHLENHVFRLSAMEIKVVNYDTIVPEVERKLRDIINPIIGKQ